MLLKRLITIALSLAEPKRKAFFVQKKGGYSGVREAAVSCCVQVVLVRMEHR